MEKKALIVNKLLNKIPILLIILLSFNLLFWDINNTPPGVLVDEASLGYNSYSVLNTGKDEWGNFLPLTLKSFGDYKPSGYIYFAIPFIKLFGLNTFSVRLPSVISGLISILLIYLIIKKATKIDFLAIISAFILSISPWFIFIHRMAWEPNISLTLFLAGLYFLIISYNKFFIFLISAFYFSLSINIYVPYKIYTPLLIFSFLPYLLNKKILNKKSVTVFIFVLVLFCAPVIYETLFKGADTRFKQVSLFNASGTPMYIDEQRQFCGMHKNRQLLFLCYLIWNKPTVMIKTYLVNYLSGFSSDFLFLEGDKAEFVNILGVGGLYYWLLPFYIIGIAALIINRNKHNFKLIIIWLLIAPFVPALANKPHYIRANMILIPTVLVTAIGIWYLVEQISYRYKKIYILMFLFISFISLIRIMVDYYFIYTKKAEAWDDYYKDAYSFLSPFEDNYDQIYVKKVNRHPYIYMVFYTAYNPYNFQKDIKRNGFEVLELGKYKFVENDFKYIYCEWLKGDMKKSIFITDELIKSYNPIKVITSFNGVHTKLVIYDIEETHKLLEYRSLEKINCI